MQHVCHYRDMLMVFPHRFDISYPYPFSTCLLLLKWPALDFGLEDVNLSCLNVDTSFYSSLLLITITPLALIALAFFVGVLWHCRTVSVGALATLLSCCRSKKAEDKDLSPSPSSRSSTSALSFPSSRESVNNTSFDLHAHAFRGSVSSNLSQDSSGRIKPLRRRSTIMSVNSSAALKRHAIELKRSARKAANNRLIAVILLIVYVTLPLATMWIFRTFAW